MELRRLKRCCCTSPKYQLGVASDERKRQLIAVGDEWSATTSCSTKCRLKIYFFPDAVAAELQILSKLQ